VGRGRGNVPRIQLGLQSGFQRAGETYKINPYRFMTLLVKCGKGELLTLEVVRKEKESSGEGDLFEETACDLGKKTHSPTD